MSRFVGAVFARPAEAGDLLGERVDPPAGIVALDRQIALAAHRGAAASSSWSSTRDRARRASRGLGRLEVVAQPSSRRAWAGRVIGKALGYRAPIVPAVEVEQLVVRYGDLVAVDELSRSRPRRAGHRAARAERRGQDSTVETLEGYRRPTGGAVRVLGLDPVADHARAHRPDRRDAAARRRLPGHPGRRGGATVRRLLRPTRAEPDELLERVGLTDTARRTVAAAVGRRAAAPVARARPRRAARGGLPRRAHGRRRREPAARSCAE